MGNNLSKDGLMSHETTESHDSEVEAPQGAQEEEPKTYQVVGEVTAHQAYDGQPA